MKSSLAVFLKKYGHPVPWRLATLGDSMFSQPSQPIREGSLMLLQKFPLRFCSLIFAALFTANCGGSEANYQTDTYAPPANLSIDPELKPLLDLYLEDAAKAGVVVLEENVQEFKGLIWTDKVNALAASDASILGVCVRRPALRYVEILKPNDEGKANNTRVDAITLKIMVYRELGHCLHDFSGHTDGKSASVMNTSLQPARFFDPDGLIDDHFKMLKKLQDGNSEATAI